MRLLPDIPPDQLVLVSRTVKTHAPNLAANIYLVNRLLGKPAPAPTRQDEPEPESLPEELDRLIARIYGTDTTETNPPQTSPAPIGEQSLEGMGSASAIGEVSSIDTSMPCPLGVQTLPDLQDDPQRPAVPLPIEGEDEGLDCVTLSHGFVADTPIRTAEGEKPIEQVQVGELLWTRCGWRPARALHKSRPSRPVLTLTLSNGRSLTGTPTQPVWVKDRGWINIEAVRFGNLLIPPDLQDSYSRGATRMAAPALVMVRATENPNSGQTAAIWAVETEEHAECYAAGVLVKDSAPWGIMGRPPPAAEHLATRVCFHLTAPPRSQITRRT